MDLNIMFINDVIKLATIKLAAIEVPKVPKLPKLPAIKAPTAITSAKHNISGTPMMSTQKNIINKAGPSYMNGPAMPMAGGTIRPL